MRLRKPSRRSMPVRLVWSWTSTATWPSPPISSAILSAARAAAAMLSVAAVATGMSLSTPESKPTIGMPLDWASSKQRNRGLGVQGGQADGVRVLGQGSLQHLDLLVDHGFRFRAFEGDLDAEVVGSLLGAGFDGLPELMLEALGDDGNVDASSSAAASSAALLHPAAASSAAGSRGRSRRGTADCQCSHQQQTKHEGQQFHSLHMFFSVERNGKYINPLSGGYHTIDAQNGCF